ncbi:MAG: Kup system potassium uptake protein [uncultured Acidimicrobiales bacterium]|uniref:Probable potassium transport system protein Kup n=1 Tax=uncultured Acidimicrobiales bacterium TaxID=310071 RepID=A0A6J4H6S5_9ACTN|nr:MAG: Kup system potassium uptake protein [uncultured Acidimicrobiales bacterium]
MADVTSAHAPSGRGLVLAIAALGVVFGDIGTSPLYAFRESFEHQHLPVDRTNALGLASLAFWALVIIISVKYLALVMRAENHGEGGILTLTALVMPRSRAGRRRAALVMLGVFGTALLYGDGLITPAISVLSAVEGFSVASSAFDDYVLPLACLILVVLFLVQRWGTGGIGRVFGPVMVVWFAVLGVLGLTQIVQRPGVLRAVNPLYIVQFFAAEPLKAFLALGSIFLVVTGGEALYADMGHFGRRAIGVAWYAVVLPGLLLCYFGQAALLIRDPAAIENPFYRMAPQWAVTPLAILATMASVIASQALISGAFSLTVQAVQLDYLPRVKVRHTSGAHRGQVYVPLVNWALMIGCVGLVLGFRTSSNLAAAYGIAVTTTMVITSVLFAVVARRGWGWSRAKVALVITPLLLVDSAFLAANIPKIPQGGWFPLLVALGLLVQMATWHKGRQLVAARIRRGRPLGDVLGEVTETTRVDGTAVFLFRDLGTAPPALVNNLRHNKVLHRSTLIVCVQVVDFPRVDPAERAEVTEVEPGVHQVLLRFGFMEEADVPKALQALVDDGCPFDLDDVTYFLARESVLSGEAEGMHPVLERLFGVLNRGADSAARFFNLPSDRVFEVGTQVEI